MVDDDVVHSVLKPQNVDTNLEDSMDIYGNQDELSEREAQNITRLSQEIKIFLIILEYIHEHSHE